MGVPILAAAALGAQALGSIAQGQAASNSAKYNAAIEENNAIIQRQNAEFAAKEGEANVAAEQQKTRATVGSIKAAQAANNIDVNTGSAVDVRSSASELGELNAINIRANAVRQAYGYQTKAFSDTEQAQLDRQQGKYDAAAGYLEAGTNLLSGYEEGAQSGMWKDYLSNNSLNGGK